MTPLRVIIHRLGTGAVGALDDVELDRRDAQRDVDADGQHDAGGAAAGSAGTVDAGGDVEVAVEREGAVAGAAAVGDGRGLRRAVLQGQHVDRVIVAVEVQGAVVEHADVRGDRILVGRQEGHRGAGREGTGGRIADDQVAGDGVDAGGLIERQRAAGDGGRAEVGIGGRAGELQAPVLWPSIVNPTFAVAAAIRLAMPEVLLWLTTPSRSRVLPLPTFTATVSAAALLALTRTMLPSQELLPE